MEKLQDKGALVQNGFKKTAFTLVELIVVITILAILGTIAFISFQGYSASARDSKRIADIQNIKKSLELFSLNTGKYPLADNYFIVSYAGEDVRYQGTVGEQVRTNLSKNLQKVPTDPLTGLEYIYSTTYDQIQYEVLAIYETDVLSQIMPQTLAKGLDFPQISGTYNGLFVKTPSYYVPTPSIINSNVWGGIKDLTTEPTLIKSQVVTGGDNIPGESTGALDITLTAYTGTITEESTDQEKVDLINTLQEAYSGSQIADVSPYDDLLDLTNNTDKTDYVDTVVLNTNDYSNSPYSCDNWNGTFVQTECQGGYIIVSDGYSTGTYISEVRDNGDFSIWDNIDTGVTGNTIFVRSCDDSECSGESWVELGTESSYDLTVDNNQYFQYKIDLNEGNDVCSVAITSYVDYCGPLNGTFFQTECSTGAIVISDGYTTGSYTSEIDGTGDYTVWDSINVGDTGNTTSVRSCDDVACSGEPWIELGTNSYYDLTVDDNPYFQYKIDIPEGGEIPNVIINSSDFCSSLNGTFSNTECSGGSVVVSDGYTSGTYTSEVTGGTDYKVWDSIDVGTAGSTVYVRSCDDASCVDDDWVVLGTSSYYDLDLPNNPYFQYKVDVPQGSSVPSVVVSSSDFCSSLTGTFVQTECSGGYIVISDGYTSGSYSNPITDSGDANTVWQTIDVGTAGNTVSVRSCDDGLCSGEEWIVLGTNRIYDLSTVVSDNQYFQYKIDVPDGGEVPNVNVYNSDFCGSLNGTFYQTECSGGSIIISDGYTSGIYTSEVINGGAIKIWESIDVSDTGNTTYVRSCNDSVCSGEPWVELGTASSYNLDLDNNQYFQYKIDIVEGGVIPNVDIVSSDFCSVLNGTYYQVECAGGSIGVSEGYTSGTYTSEITGGGDYMTWESINVGSAGNTVYVRSCDDSVCSGEPWIELGTASNYDLSIDDNPYFQYKIDISGAGEVTNLIIVSSIAGIISSTECIGAGWIWVDYTDDVFIGTTRGHGFCISPTFGDWNNDSDEGDGGISYNGWGSYFTGHINGWDADSIDDDGSDFPFYGQTRSLDSETSYDCIALGSASNDYTTSDTLLGRMKWLATTGNDYTEAQSIAWIVNNGTTTPLSTVNGHAIPALYIADCIDGIKDLTTDMTYIHSDDSTDEVTYVEYNTNVVTDTNSGALALDNITYQNRQKYLTAWTQESGSHLPSAFSSIENNSAGGEYDYYYYYNPGPPEEFYDGRSMDDVKGEYQVACETGKFGEVNRFDPFDEYIGGYEYNNDERVFLANIGWPTGDHWGISARIIGFLGCGMQHSTPTGNRFGLASARFVVRP